MEPSDFRTLQRQLRHDKIYNQCVLVQDQETYKGAWTIEGLGGWQGIPLLDSASKRQLRYVLVLLGGPQLFMEGGDIRQLIQVSSEERRWRIPIIPI